VYKLPSKTDQIGHSLSDEAKDLVIRLLQENPAKRPNVEELKAHPFFTFKPIVPDSLPVSILERELNKAELIAINE
jgi:serine/threonine protein kinase